VTGSIGEPNARLHREEEEPNYLKEGYLHTERTKRKVTMIILAIRVVVLSIECYTV
jgi:hypothetical protein